MSDEGGMGSIPFQGQCAHGVDRWLACKECDRHDAPPRRPFSFGDCGHGVPLNLPCGQCQEETQSDAVRALPAGMVVGVVGPELLPLPTSGIDATLAERGSRYGSFDGHARITQAIKRACQDSPKWPLLADDQREAIEMIAHKLGRILNGDPDYHDSWHDIVGYTKLVADRLLTAKAER